MSHIQGLASLGKHLSLIHLTWTKLCRCEYEDILLEMDRILRPEGVVIFRDAVDPLIKVKQIARGMRWDLKLVDHEDGPFVPEKILIAVKQYWVAGEMNSTSSNR